VKYGHPVMHSNYAPLLYRFSPIRDCNVFEIFESYDLLRKETHINNPQTPGLLPAAVGIYIH
jgi:hypothetical protein